MNPGEKVFLGWDAAGATKLTLEPGGDDVTALNGPAKTVEPKETTTYTLTGTNEAGTVATKTLTVKVVPPPQVKSFSATGAIAVGQPSPWWAISAEARRKSAGETKSSLPPTRAPSRPRPR